MKRYETSKEGFDEVILTSEKEEVDSKHTNKEDKAFHEQNNSTENKGDKRMIKKGDTIDLNQLLFTKDRDYLVKNNNEKVKAEQLKGKVIGIYLSRLLRPYYKEYEDTAWSTKLIKNVYNDLQHDNNFEVVFVAAQEKILRDGYIYEYTLKSFENVFSAMPWTAIPFSDVTSREHLFKRFDVQLEEYDVYGMLVIVDPAGVVLECDTRKLISHFVKYGAVGYPFTDERITFLMEEDYATAPSLKALLASPKRDYVISNKGDKVPIHTLEDKVVALYFYRCPNRSNRFRDELLLVYDELVKVQKTFEVVLVFGYETSLMEYEMASEEFFWGKFKTMPWLALPFGDPSCKKLIRIFGMLDREAFDDGAVVIVGPHAKFIEPYGFEIIHRYKISGYPFNLRKVAEIETEKLKELKLEMLWESNTVFKRTDGSEVPFRQIVGKRIMLILEKDRRYAPWHDRSVPWFCRLDEYYLNMLRERYLEAKGTDDEFEVICVLPNMGMGSFIDKIIDGDDIIWFLSSLTELRVNLGPYFCCWDMEEILHTSILAFGEDGSVVRRTRYPTLEDTKFPFSACDLEEQTLSFFNKDYDSDSEWNY